MNLIFIQIDLIIYQFFDAKKKRDNQEKNHKKTAKNTAKKTAKKTINKTVKEVEPVKSKRPRRFQTVRGMRDILPQDQPYWQKIRRSVDKVAHDFNYQRIDTPIVEFRELWERGTGASTDIVEKEMFKFRTRGGDDVRLRPEGTPSVVRAYLQHGMQSYPKPVKLFYIGPMYRYDRPQEGRYRELFQFGFEAIGEQDAILDTQLIQLALASFSNQLASERSLYNSTALDAMNVVPTTTSFWLVISRIEKNPFAWIARRDWTKNPLRILDCKEEKCTQVVFQAPQTIDHLMR